MAFTTDQRLAAAGAGCTALSVVLPWHSLNVTQYTVPVGSFGMGWESLGAPLALLLLALGALAGVRAFRPTRWQLLTAVSLGILALSLWRAFDPPPLSSIGVPDDPGFAVHPSVGVLVAVIGGVLVGATAWRDRAGYFR